MNKKCPFCGGTEFTDIKVIGGAHEQRVQTGKDYLGRPEYKTKMFISHNSLLPYFFDDQCTEGHVMYQAFSNMHAEVCKSCGHIEFFANQDVLDEIHNEDDRVAAYNTAVSIAKKEVENIIKDINAIFDDIIKFTTLSKDDSITVKQQKEYLAIIEEKTNKYNQTTNGLNNYINGLDDDVKKAIEPLKNNIKKNK